MLEHSNNPIPKKKIFLFVMRKKNLSKICIINVFDSAVFFQILITKQKTENSNKIKTHPSLYKSFNLI